MEQENVRCYCYNSQNSINSRNDNEVEQIEKSEMINLLTCSKSKSFQNLEIDAITSLDLSNCYLTDVPIAIKELPLKDLNLSKNKLIKIPQCFYLGLELLEVLNISYNEIAKFDIEPKCCKSLRKLSLRHNKLIDIPQWILCLYASNLEELYYDFNKVTTLRCIFNNSMRFPVRKLSMNNCILRKEDCKFLKECKNLEELDISNSIQSRIYLNMIENVEQLFIQPIWKNISILKLNNLTISTFPMSITWLETLTELHLSNNDFMWLPTEGLEFLVNLEVLDISHNAIYSIPEKLSWLEHVKELKLSFNNIEIIPDFSKMKTLEILDLYYNKLPSFDCNMDSTNLKYLDLEFNFFNTEGCDVTYQKMRDEFRGAVANEEDRSNGVRDSYVLQYSDEESISHWSEDAEINQQEISSISVTSEDWDEEIRLSMRCEGITLSDDEWRGFEEDVISSVKQKVTPSDSVIICNEDVIFCDAD